MQADLAEGLHAVLLADYEWGAKLVGAGLARLGADDGSALRVLVFDTLQRLDDDAAGRWMAGCEGSDEPTSAGTLDLAPEIDRQAFEAAIGRIHEAIRDGETYQVNFTYRIRGAAFGKPIALYRRLRARQRVAFGALIALPEGGWVLSRSPELFVRHVSGELSARPMKGTAARSAAPEGDSETARLLHDDVKNRAENLMIVDLLRNDLGRVAVTRLGDGAASCSDIEPYTTVFQMTSTVEARRRRPEVGLAGTAARRSSPAARSPARPSTTPWGWIAATGKRRHARPVLRRDRLARCPRRGAGTSAPTSACR